MSLIQRIPAKNAYKLLEALTKKLPKTSSTFNLIKAPIIFSTDFPLVYTTDPISPLVAIAKKHPLTNVDFLHICWDPEEHTDEVVHEFLVKIPSVRWKEAIYLYNIDISLSNKINKILSSSDLIGGCLQKIRRDIFIVQYQPEELPSLQVPENFELSSLKDQDLSFALSTWYQRPVDNVTFLEEIRKYPSTAIYDKTTPAAPPVAFSFILNGILSGAYVSPEYRLHRLAIAIVNLLARKSSQFGLIPLGMVRLDKRDTILKGLINNNWKVYGEGFHEIHHPAEDLTIVLPFF